LIEEARKMAEAEGMKGKFVGGTSQIWASMGILINKKRVNAKNCGQIIARWAKEFQRDGGGKDISEYRVGKEKRSINKMGELQIQWPTSVDRRKEIDFLIAVSTKPRFGQSGKAKYPSSNEIAATVRSDSTRRYFVNNLLYAITTFQDNSVINLL
jgi:hypothetical protein